MMNSRDSSPNNKHLHQGGLINTNKFNRHDLAVMFKSQQLKRKSTVFNKIQNEQLIAEVQRLREQNQQQQTHIQKLKVRLELQIKDRDQLLRCQTDHPHINNRAIPTKMLSKIKHSMREKQELINKLENELKREKKKVRNTRIAELEAQNRQLLLETIRLTEQMKHMQNKFTARPYLEQIDRLHNQLHTEKEQRQKVELEKSKIQMEVNTIRQNLHDLQNLNVNKQRNFQKDKKNMTQLISKLKHETDVARFNSQGQQQRSRTVHRNHSEAISNSKLVEEKQIKSLKNEIIVIKRSLKDKQFEIIQLKQRLKSDTSRINNKDKIQENSKKTQRHKNSNPKFNTKSAINTQNIVGQEKKTIQVINLDKKLNIIESQNHNKVEINQNQSELSEIKRKESIQNINIDHHQNQYRNEAIHEKQRKIDSQLEMKIQQRQNNILELNSNKKQKDQFYKNQQNEISKKKKENLFDSDSSLERYLKQDDSEKQVNNFLDQQKMVDNSDNGKKLEALKKEFMEGQADEEETEYFEVDKEQQNKFKQKSKGNQQKSKHNCQQNAQKKFQSLADNKNKHSLEQPQQGEKQKKRIKVLKATITYRMQAQQFTYEDACSQLDQQDQKSISGQQLNFMFTNQPFYLNQEQSIFIIGEILSGKLSISIANLKKKLKKFIGQVMILSEQQQIMTNKLRSKILKNQKQIIKSCQKQDKTQNGVLTKKILVKVLQKLKFNELQIQWFLSQTSLYSVDCTQLSYEKIIEEYKKTPQSNQEHEQHKQEYEDNFDQKTKSIQQQEQEQYERDFQQ